MAIWGAGGLSSNYHLLRVVRIRSVITPRNLFGFFFLIIKKN